MQDNLNLFKDKMNKSLDSLQKEFNLLRTSRANPKVLDGIFISYYETMTPLNQLAQISVPESNQILISPYDRSLVKSIEQAILASNLGITPQVDTDRIRLTFPLMTEEKRKELVKEASKLAENSKVAIRNLRRDLNDVIKKAKLPKDEEEGYLEDSQKITDDMIKKIDQLLDNKTKEIMTI